MNHDIRPLLANDHPPGLAKLNTPPANLYIRGALPDWNELKTLCVIGARASTTYGEDCCRHLIDGLRGAPVRIASGMALGIDGIALEAALDAGLSTLGFPASGLDDASLYPRSNVPLAQACLNADGALISEHPPGTHPRTYHFHARNRLMAAVCDAVLIIEARVRSGTLVTAKHATELNTDVLAVPGSIFAEFAEGPHRLISEGARIVRSADDILDALGLQTRSESIASGLSTVIADCSDDERSILEFLREPLTKGVLLSLTGYDAASLSQLLVLLELKGHITERGGMIRKTR